MKKKVLIIEDQPNSREALVQMVRKISRDIDIFSTDNAEAAYSEAMQTTIDVFLVDIILNTKKPGDVSGVIFAERIRQVGKYAFTPVIFITSLQDLELSAYRKIHCFGYIEKPFCDLEVEKLIEQALAYETKREDSKRIYFRVDGVLFSQETRDIIYVETYKHVLTIYSRNEILRVPYMTCGQFLREADAVCFVQCSRNTIINKNFIRNIDFTNRMIQLQHYENPVAIGVTYTKKLEKELVV